MRTMVLPALVMVQSVRSISSRLEQQVPIQSRPLSVINLQDSNWRHVRFLHLSAIATRALLVSRWQHVRSMVIRLTQPATSSETPSSVTHLHLLSPISTKFLQLRPIILRLGAKTWKPSSFSTVKLSLKSFNLERKSGASSCKIQHYINGGRKKMEKEARNGCRNVKALQENSPQY